MKINFDYFFLFGYLSQLTLLRTIWKAKIGWFGKLSIVVLSLNYQFLIASSYGVFNAYSNAAFWRDPKFFMRFQSFCVLETAVIHILINFQRLLTPCNASQITSSIFMVVFSVLATLGYLLILIFYSGFFESIPNLVYHLNFVAFIVNIVNLSLEIYIMMSDKHKEYKSNNIRGYVLASHVVLIIRIWIFFLFSIHVYSDELTSFHHFYNILWTMESIMFACVFFIVAMKDGWDTMQRLIAKIDPAVMEATTTENMRDAGLII